MRMTALAVAALVVMACGGTEDEDVQAVGQEITCAVYEAGPRQLVCLCTDEAGALVGTPPVDNCAPPVAP
jgi:hypothetical protein